MKLHILHRTHYTYAEPVTQNSNEVRLKPMSAHGQSCDAYQVKVVPGARLSDYVDFYFNYVQFFEVAEPHRELVIESQAEVTSNSNVLPLETASAPMTRLAECVRMEQCYDFIQPSAYVSIDPAVWRLALDATYGETEVWQACIGIMQFIHSNFTYKPLATTVSTHMLEVLEQKAGVCQDFAHIMLGMCRTLKIPARYVSGYVYNGPSDKLAGAQASHAWCEVYIPDLGWRALDPTNNQQADGRYVKVAAGRDYADVAPIKGQYRGTPKKSMAVSVQVSEVS